MALDNSQLATLKADIATQIAGGSGTAIEGLDPTNADHAFAIADFYNEDSATWVFRSSVSTDEGREAIDWEEVLTGSPLSVLKQWAFNTLLANGDFNPSRSNERVGFTTIFNGASYVNTRNNLLAASTRIASRAEALFVVDGTGPTGTGGGNGSTAGQAALMTFEGSVSSNDVLNSNNV